MILRHKGVFDASSKHKQIDALNALERLCQTDNIEASLQEAAEALERIPGNPDSPAHCAVRNQEDASDRTQHELSSEEVERASPIPRLKSIKSLQVLDKAAGSGLINDDELLEFLVSSRKSALWQEILDGNPVFSPDLLRTSPSLPVFDLIRESFLAEYDGAINLPLPAGYAFHKNGQISPPNLMQRLTAFRLQKSKRLVNASGVGAGKSLSAVNASQVVGAKLTIMVAVNATMQNIDDTVKNTFPDAVRIVKERGPFTIDPHRPTFIIINFESFQQNAWSDEMVSELLSHRIDMIVVDEIQSVRLRSGNEESNRRRRLRSLIDGAAIQNPDLYVLGMSATPVMNDLHEAKMLLELVTGNNLDQVPTRPTVPNAILYHQLLTKHGLRYRPNYPQTIETVTPVIDGSSALPQLRLVKPRDVLGMEQALLSAKLPTIQQLLKLGTLIYTPFVTGIVDRLADAVTSKGLKAGLFTGDDKDGYEKFLRREVDVLIGSEPIGTGVDKLQEVGNRLIFASLPWTSAHYDQVVGRLHRQGMQFDKVEVFIPQVELRVGNNAWSYDKRRFDRIQFKRTLADAAVDGVIPEGKLPSQEEMQEHSLRALRDWISDVQGFPVEPDAIHAVMRIEE